MREEVIGCAQIREKGGVVHMFHIVNNKTSKKNQQRKKQLLRLANFIKLATDILKNIMDIFNF